jgi:hypothetical protein
MKPATIDRALTDPKLLGAALGDIASWRVWLVVLKAAFGLPLDAQQLQQFTAIAGNRGPPMKRVRELWAIVGRRAGKSRMAATIAVFVAIFIKHKTTPGEQPLVLVLAANLQQAKVVFSYALGFINASAVLRQELADATRNEIRLKNGVTIAVHANSFRSVRGRTLVAAVFDETAFWRDDSTATPDSEVYTATLPSLITTGGMLVSISSAYRRTGLMYAKHKRYFGVEDQDTLVVQGSSRQFNPLLTDEAIVAQLAADPIAGRSEWYAEFRDDLVGFLDDALVESCVDRNRPLELPPRSGLGYRAHVDASGGAVGGDAYTIAIGHREQGLYVIDLVRARAGPFDPAALTKEFAALIREYRIGSVTGDYYAAEWTVSTWRKEAISYQRSELTASQLYLETLPLFTRGLVSLPDHQPLLRELLLLERSPQRSGKDQVTHPRGAHDDLANVCCGVLRTLARYYGADYLDSFVDAVPQPETPPHRHPNLDQALLARIMQPVALISRGSP